MRANHHATAVAVGASVFKLLKLTMTLHQMMERLSIYNGITKHMRNIPQKSRRRAPVVICAIRIR